MLPLPPDLKPTIIQMQNGDNEEPEQNKLPEPVQMNAQGSGAKGGSNGKPKKKRRRSSSSLISQNEIEKRRREHKTAHSIIEKKRRIRMNREFEALKFMIPACRNNLNSSNNNGEGMYKLTILQSTVDYIRYLHSIVNLQKDEISKYNPRWAQEEDLDFANADVDTDSYRNLENEYDFAKLFDDFTEYKSDRLAAARNASSTKSHGNLADDRPLHDTTSVEFIDTADLGTISKSSTTTIRRNSMLDFNKFQALPSPIITPEIYPQRGMSFSSSTGSHSVGNNFIALPSMQDKQGSPTFKDSLDFQFPKNAGNFQFSQPGKPARQSQSSSLQGSPQSSLDIINESMARDTETSASQALLSMRRDTSVSNIRTLLN